MMGIGRAKVLVLVALLCVALGEANGQQGVGGAGTNPRPLIGILSQPGGMAPEGQSYIAASYVKFVEAGGAQAVPVLYDEPESSLRRKFDAMSGLIFPGGGADLGPDSTFRKTASLLLKWGIDSNDAGNPFVIHGTCLGFQLLSVLLSDADVGILTSFDAENYPTPLNFTSAKGSSKLVSAMPAPLAAALQHSPLAFENHQSGVASKAMHADDSLSKFFSLIATTVDRASKAYVAMIEAHDYPIFGVQFHPEKNAFEWAVQERIDHSLLGVQLMQSISNAIVEEARKSRHRPKDLEEEQDLVIYQHRPIYTGKLKPNGEVESNFEQIYLFDDPTLPRHKSPPS